MLNATWLDTFTTLCETGHFTRAAERLNMTQPGVSQHLRKLEAQLGQSLIAREGKSFTLTAAGEAVFQVFDAITFSLAYVVGAVVLLGQADWRLSLPLLNRLERTSRSASPSAWCCCPNWRGRWGDSSQLGPKVVRRCATRCWPRCTGRPKG